MRKLFLILFIAFSANSFGQSNHEISISFSSGENDLIMFQQLVGTGSHSGTGYFTLGAHYLRSVNSWLDLETGLIYGYHNITIEPAFTGTPVDPIYENMSIASIPLLARANFWNYFYFNAGALVDLDFSNSQYLDDQTGIGLKMGVGFHYRFKPGLGVYINPILTSHSLIPFSMDQYHERLFESGIRIGISYKL